MDKEPYVVYGKNQDYFPDMQILGHFSVFDN